MTEIPTLLMKGLAECVILRVIEREPRDAAGILGELGSMFGEAPNKNQVLPALDRMRKADLVRGHGGGATLGLTQAGARRLSSYRELPPGFKQVLVDTFRIDADLVLPRAGPPLHAGNQAPRAQDPAPPSTGPSPQPRPDATPPADRLHLEPPVPDRWVSDLLAHLPRGAPIRAPHAQVRFERDPSRGAWSLHVEHHRPRPGEEASTCPLA
ncbi:MAG: hypothetical protein R3185_09355, partial [Candidatus Thermoplasmatota archaeon]|nr:hypothetical protein [Candidatus Thermoplasmatota archaeon]